MRPYTNYIKEAFCFMSDKPKLFGSDKMSWMERTDKYVCAIICVVAMLRIVVAIGWEISIRQTMVNETTGVVERVAHPRLRRVYVAYTLNGERYFSRLRSSDAFTPSGGAFIPRRLRACFKSVSNHQTMAMLYHIIYDTCKI